MHLDSNGEEVFDSFLEFFNNLIETTDKIKKKDKFVLYRGQRDAAWDLIPRICREEYNFMDIDFLQKEKELLDEFIRLARPYMNADLLNKEWDLLATAQHHGLPTRLLDWTTNPLVALYFAFMGNDKSRKNRAVWMMLINKSDIVDCTKLNPFNTTKTMVFRPNHVNQRLIAQNGWFTAHKYLQDKNQFINLNYNAKFIKNIYKFTIKNSIREEILSRLDSLGINQFTLFPSLDGLSKYLEWKKS